MDYKAAILKLQADSPELAEIVVKYVASINEESASRRVQLRELEALVGNLKKVVGDDADLVAFASESKKKADTESTAIADLQAKLDAALIAAATEQREYLLLKSAQIAQADEKALHKLLEAVPTDKISVDNNEVKIEDKPLKDYAKSQGGFWERALFPVQQNDVPTGGKNADVQEVNPASAYIKSQADRLISKLGGK
jgi:hypothetical protein